jgi:anthranilate phosphoribosyltransferase
MRHVGKVRSQIKMRTIFNLLGPLGLACPGETSAGGDL